MVCTFFGHRDCYELNADILENTINMLINKGVDTFYVGNQGYFDDMVFSTLLKLHKHRHISIHIVIAYMPALKSTDEIYDSYTLYPEELESVHPKFAIDKRNDWMLERSDYCLCYVNHTWGGAYKFAHRAKCRGLNVINLGHAEL